MKGKIHSLPPILLNQDREKHRMLLLAILTFLVMSPALLNGFTYWDDHLYVSENPDIRDLSNIPKYFTSYLMGNYHPFVPLSHTIEYLLFGLKPWVYILNNILLHVLNVLGVYILIQKYTNTKFIAFFSALAFGIHPLHVESVVWISERKDVLYTFFFLAGLISWEKARTQGQIKFKSISFLFFVASCFSKGQAVVFPMILILADYWHQQDFRKINFLDKIPFLLVSILFGVIAIYAQGSEGAVKTQNTFKMPDNFLAACWGFIFYLRKMILPWPLSAFYPYPDITKPYPAYFWVAPPLVGMILFLVWKFRTKTPEWIWAILFYSFSIFLVLQILPVGRAITADRYFYIPSIGLFMAVGISLHKYILQGKSQQILMLVIILTIGWSGISIYRTTRWKDTETLFRDVLVSYPKESVALNNIATMLAMQKKYDEALTYYLRTVENNPHHIEGVYNIGVLYDEISDFEKSANWFDRVFRMDSAYKDVREKLALAHNKWGNQLKDKGDFASSEKAYQTALQLNPGFAEAWSNLGNQAFFKQDYVNARNYFRQALTLKPDFAEAWSNLGSLYATQNILDSALICFRKSTEINPEYGPGYFNEGYAEMVKGNRDKAVALFRKSASLNHPQAVKQLEAMGIQP